MSAQTVTVEEALQNVELLDLLPMVDEQPCIEPMPASISYTANFDTRFEDRRAYITGMAKYIEEAEMHASMQKMLEAGEKYAVMLYTWRSCSRAIPAVKTSEQPNRNEIYEKTIEVLEPEIRKLFDFFSFTNQAVGEFIAQVQRLCHTKRRNDFVSEAYLLTLGRFMNMFAVLDALKNIKASVKNDFSTYRRAGQFLTRYNDIKQQEESQTLSLFLASHDKITEELKTKLAVINNYDELIIDIITTCINYYENKRYLVPDDKHMYLKVIGFGLGMLDNPGKTDPVSIYALERKKKLNLAKIDKMFKELQVVTLFGDMQITLSSYIEKMSDYSNHKDRWTCTQKCDQRLEDLPQYDLIHQLKKIKEDHVKYISALALCSNSSVVSAQNVAPHNKTNQDHQARHHYYLALNGLQLLSNWTAVVMEVYSWKLVNPCDHKTNRDCPEDAEDYERATRYNYNSREKFALVEIIGMIKGLQVLMGRMEQVFHTSICNYVYAKIQDFVQSDLREPLRASIKKKKEKMRTIISSIRATCADWKQGKPPQNDPCLRGEKDPKGGFHPDVPRRTVGPSSTQLYYIRLMAESLLEGKEERNDLNKLKMKKEFFDKVEDFVRKSTFFYKMLKFNETLSECCDLSQLWFREFYLELTMGKRIQFPIEMSLPWILTDHILETKQAGMMEFILQPLDLYSDSGHFALTKFRKQFLYDEIEAEVNLCFDQFVFKISDQIFEHYKSRAAAMLLDVNFVTELKRQPFPKGNKYETLLQQRHIQLLGRSIDLCRLITQRITQDLQRSLDFAISKFESTDLAGIVELDYMIEINRLTHKLLSKYLYMDPFDNILHEANESVTKMGRITEHVIWELNYDFLPNFNFNSSTDRFVRSPRPFSEDKNTRDKAAKAEKSAYAYGTKQLNDDYSDIMNLYTGFIGKEHFTSLVRLLGYSGIALTIKGCILPNSKTILKNTILVYFKSLQKLLPTTIRLPKASYGTAATYTHITQTLRDVVGFSDMKSQVFHYYREIGNGLIFVLLIERALNQQEMQDMLQAAPFRRQFPRIHWKEGERYENKQRKLEQKYANMNLTSIAQIYGTAEQARAATEGDTVSGERLCCGLSLFESVLRELQKTLSEDKEWKGGDHPRNGCIYIEESAEFHRVWSACQWIIGIPVVTSSQTNTFNCEYFFGDGLNYAGMTIIYLLRQDLRFNLLDFSYHFLKVHQNDPKPFDRERDVLKDNIDLRIFVERIKKIQSLNNNILQLLRRFCKPDEKEKIREYAPPVHPNSKPSQQ